MKLLRQIGIQFGVTFVALALLLGIGGPLLEHAPKAVHEVVLYARFADDASALPRDATLDGNADDVEIQALLASLPSTGGKIILGAGNIRFNATVSRAINNVTIEGSGKGTYVYNNAATALFSAGAQTGWQFKDIRTDAGGITAASDTLFVHVYIGTSPRDSSVMTGTTMPTTATAVVGQQFYQDTTGRDVIYSYNGSAWKPIESVTDTMTLYVDTASGTDDFNHGTATGASAYRTLTYAYNSIPRRQGLSVSVYVSGAVTENLVINAGEGRVTFIGATSANYTGAATGGNAGGATTAANVTGAFAANAYDNKLIRFTSGVNNGVTRVVGLTTTTAMWLVGDPLGGAPAGGDTYQILNLTPFTGYVQVWGTGLSYGASSPPTTGPGGSVNFQYFAFSGNGGGTSQILYTNNAQVEYDYCTVNDTGAVMTSLTEVGAAWTGFFYSAIYRSVSNTNGVTAMFHGQVDLIESRVTNKDATGGIDVGASGFSIITLRSSELTNSYFGAWSRYNGHVEIEGSTTKSWVHGTNTGILAYDHSYAFVGGLVTYAKKLDQSADANVANAAADAPSYSYITP